MSPLLVRVAAVLAPALLLRAQAEPRIGYAYPAGLQQGTTGEVVVGGRALQGTVGVHFSGAGVTAEVLDYTRPMTPKERNEAREEMQRLARLRQEKGKLEPADESKLAELRRKLATNPRQQPNPQIAETVVLRIAVAADAAPGMRDLRLLGPAGLSNPVHFCVGTWREYRETEPNDKEPDAGLPSEQPVVVNGQLLPGDVDRFRLRARKGSPLVVAVQARALIPYLADAVPGWCQATLALWDQSGNQVAFVDDDKGQPDPLLRCVVPADGDYVLEIRDALYRGREDFVYRMALGDLPLVGSAPAVQFAFDAPRECGDQEPNDTVAAAQRLTLPVVVNGRIDRPGDRDVFRIEGKAGFRLVAEVLARRLDSPLDAILTLTDATGRELAVNDDAEDRRAALTTHHADPLLATTLPADGVYWLQLRDVQAHGGAEYVYRLRAGPPQPDFALRVVPSAINLRAGATVAVTVHALRQDGFAGDIALALDQAPPGFTLGGGCVPGNQGAVRVTLTAPPAATDAGAPPAPFHLNLIGHAQVGGHELRRAAVPADDMMQAFAYRHLVPADELLVTLARGGGRGGGRDGLRFARRDGAPVRIPVGGTAEVLLSGPRRQAAIPEGIQLVLDDPPPGLSVVATAPAEGGVKVTLRADAAKATPGLRGNLILDVFQERAAASREAPQRPRQRTPLGTLPAIAFEVVKQ